jgi:hypothetical protein
MTRFALLISFYRLCVIALIGTALLSIGTRVAAETITVCPDGSCDYTDIQSAVFLAVNGDVIDIGPGTYSLPASVVATTPIVKPLGKALWFRGTLGTSGELLTILDGKNVRRAVECTTQETAATVFENLMIRSCPNSAVYISGSSAPTLTNCTITGNAGRGAGIAFANWSTGTSKVINCRITGNNSGGLSGGGVFVEGGTREFVNCQISQNRNANSGAGVMVSGSSSVRFIDCDITNNVISPAGPATNIDGGGAGLFLGGTSAFLDSCLISGNSASVSSSEGGGIDIYFCGRWRRAVCLGIAAQYGHSLGCLSDQRELCIRLRRRHLYNKRFAATSGDGFDAVWQQCADRSTDLWQWLAGWWRQLRQQLLQCL